MGSLRKETALKTQINGMRYNRKGVRYNRKDRPQNARWGQNAKKRVRCKRKGRCGKIAKEIRGQNAKARVVKSQTLAVGKVRPLPTWDKNKFLLVANDRGYPTEESIVYAIGEELGLARSVVKNILSTGRLRWEQMLVVASFLEMSPKEFCDIFLSGFFIEDNLGHYKCHVENKEVLLRPPKVKDRTAKTKTERLLEELEEF